MSDTPFAPFQPPGSAPAETPAPETAKEKKAREKREAKEAAKAAKENKGAPEPRQKRRSAGESKPTLKFDLQTILAAASELNADDYPLFEKLINLLDEAGKPGRERLLAAIHKIFS